MLKLLAINMNKYEKITKNLLAILNFNSNIKSD